MYDNLTRTELEFAYREAEKRIEELGVEVKEWKDKADLWCKTANLKDHNIMINKELEKENAELKEDNKVMADNYSKMEQKFYDNLTKAKEILREYIRINLLPPIERNFDDEVKLFKQAEQFISEVEK